MPKSPTTSGRPSLKAGLQGGPAYPIFCGKQYFHAEQTTMAELGLEQIPEQVPKEDQAEPREAQSGRGKIPLLRYIVIAAILSSFECYQHLQWGEGDRDTQTAGREGREGDGGTTRADSGSGGRSGIRTASTATTDAESNSKITGEAWEKGKCHSAERSTDAKVSPRDSTTRGSGKAEAQKGDGSTKGRSSRDQTKAPGPQIGKTCRGENGKRPGGHPWIRRRGEDAAQAPVGQSQQRANRDAEQGGIHATADGGLHAELRSCEWQHRCTSFGNTATEHPGAACQEHDPRSHSTHRSRISERCQGTLRCATPQSCCQRSCVTICFERSNWWHGLGEKVRCADCTMCHNVQGMRQSCTWSFTNCPHADESGKGLYERMRGNAHQVVGILLAIGLSLHTWMRPQFWRSTSCPIGLKKLCLLLLLYTVNASEDEQVARAFRVRRQAEALQQDQIYRQRWQWVNQNFGLRIPDRNNDYQAVIHRPDSLPMPTPTAIFMTFSYMRNAMQYILNTERFWTDLGPVYGPGPTWTLREMRGGPSATTLFLPGRRYFMLTTLQEDRARPSEVPVFFEIEWITMNLRHRGYTKPWTTRRTTVVQFLQQQGLLAQCTTSHRCGITIDGRPQTTTIMTVYKASYVHLLAKPMIPPSDTEDDEPAPLPLMAPLREDTTSSYDSNSASTETEISEQLHTDSSEQPTDSLICVTAIFRPVFGLQCPPFVHSVHATNSQMWLRDVYAAWPRLRYALWTPHDVDDSFPRDFPQWDTVTHKVLVTLADLPSALHQVALVVGSMQDLTVVQAWPFPPMITAHIVLYELFLWELCEHTPNEIAESL